MVAEALLLGRLTRIVARERSRAPLSERLLRAYVTIMEVDGGAISLGSTRPQRTSLAVTDDLAERLEDLQELLREGPAVEALRTGAPVGLVDGAAQDRWPMLHQSLRGSRPRPVSWLAAVPMRPRTQVLGAITLYRFGVGPPALTVEDTTFLADAIGAVIVGGFERSPVGELDWSTRDRIEQATGMVMAQLGVRAPDALSLLRAHAFAADSPLSTVAQAVLDRTLDFREQNDGEV